MEDDGPCLRLFLLGVPRLEFDGECIELARRKALALLAYLAVTAQAGSREMLATLLWPEDDLLHSRANLRRALSCLNETAASGWITADRDVIELEWNDRLWVDTHEFNRLIEAEASVETLSNAVELFRDNFMAGFTLRDSAEFDNWQSMQTQVFQQKLTTTLEKLVNLHIAIQDIEQALACARRWLHIDALHEPAQRQFMRLCAATGQRVVALRQYEDYVDLLDRELGLEPSQEMMQLYEAIKEDKPIAVSETSWFAGNSTLPPLPRLFVGRENAIRDLKDLLGINDSRTSPSSAVVVQGWPGVGKTTLAAVMAHDEDVHQYFPDGVLFTSLGQHPNLVAELLIWARALGMTGVEDLSTPEELSRRLAAVLRDRQMLLIVDDIWEARHARLFAVGGHDCATLITTRLNDLAQALASSPDDIYRLPILTDDQATQLLRKLAPQAVELNQAEALELVCALEGLPLALQVAGRLLHTEMSMGWGVAELLVELRDGARLLEEQAPADHIDPTLETSPTIRVLLQRSTSRLDREMCKRFAVLGAFAPKPATFDLDAMKTVWRIDDPRPTVRVLVARGLLEPAGTGRFQMHAILVMHAQSMFVS
jgi:DNA-binding SARP family transcriptional activator